VHLDRNRRADGLADGPDNAGLDGRPIGRLAFGAHGKMIEGFLDNLIAYEAREPFHRLCQHVG
jgi:hypothetical protein